MKEIYFTVLFCLLCTVPFKVALAQKPSKIISKAEDAFENENYEKALTLYLEVIPQVPENFKVNRNLGLSYFKLKKAPKALPYLIKAAKLAPKPDTELKYALANAYQLNWNFDEAIAQFQSLLSLTNTKEEDEISLYNKHIKECISGNLFKSKAPSAEIIHLGPTFNSSFSDHVPLLYNNDKTLLYSSSRSIQQGLSTNNEEAFQSSLNNLVWSVPRKMVVSTNFQTNDAITGISPDGRELYLYRDKNGGDIYIMKNNGGDSWSKPEPLPAPINSKYYESSFYVVKDKSFAFFSSDREGGLGGLDLYLTMKQPDGTWSEAFNLGANVNTEFDEDAPFVGNDGTLYFSSRGHNSMGGYDIFSSATQGAAWGIAENLGIPVNTPSNDIYFVTEENARRGYFASDRPESLGDKDIFEAVFRNNVATDSILAAVQPIIVEDNVVPPAAVADTVKNEKPVTGPTQPEVINITISGIVYNEVTKVPLKARISIVLNGQNTIIANLESDSISGQYSVGLEKDKSYTILVQKERYFYMSGIMNVPLNYLADTLTKNIALKKIEAGAKIVLKNIFFEYGKDILSKSSLAELNRMAGLLKENPTVKVEVSGHTDNKGKAAYNNLLSLKRARAVVNYLSKKGISTSRLVAAGYGANKPIASNRFEEGRKLNRRTEFKVISQ